MENQNIIKSCLTTLQCYSQVQNVLKESKKEEKREKKIKKEKKRLKSVL
jgi:hypothetical protein